ncbi:MAG: efflux RND transporter periplasmic adaptor subunit [Desulfobacteraceae bacterium]|nr:MAG: efflux RND transporter periplasmic adaptor subunit [Desulfobacteraceae bacterium]
MKKLLPIIIILIALSSLWVMKSMKKPPETRQVPKKKPVPVKVITVKRKPLLLPVHAMGTAQPMTRLNLFSEVSGKIIHAHPVIQTLGFFNKGEILYRIDPKPYELAVAKAKADLAQARVEFLQEQARGDIARRDWGKSGLNAPTELAVRTPQIEAAKAILDAAEQSLAQARRDVDYTTIRAPFSGILKQVFAQKGDNVSPSERMALLYSTEAALVMLPVPRVDLELLDLVPFPGQKHSAKKRVVLTDPAGPSNISWEGQVTGSSAVFDPHTRVMHLAVRVEDPYALKKQRTQCPLVFGTFLEARLFAPAEQEMVKVPRSALYKKNTVLIIDADQLYTKSVTVIHQNQSHAFIRDGLEDNTLVCIGSPDYFAEGMTVTPVPAAMEAETI